MVYYAIHQGKQTGIFEDWDFCKQFVIGYSNPVFKKFAKREDAEYFLKHGLEQIETPSFVRKKKSVADYFDQSQKPLFPAIKEKKVVEKPITNVIKPTTIFDKNAIKVFTDGGCINNGKKNAKAGYGIYFGDQDKRNVSKRVVGKQTNNVAEMTAILEAYRIMEAEIARGESVTIYTDSKYSILCSGSYGSKQEMSGWNNHIPNKFMVKKLFETCRKHRNTVRLVHVRAHTGKDDELSKGNHEADRLANAACFL